MKRRNLLYFILFLCLPLLVVSCNDDPKEMGEIDRIEVPITVDASSTLFGRIADRSGNGIEGVVVSDGFQSVQTDGNGVYQMVRNAEAEFVFYSTPADCEISVNKINYPDFFASIDRTQEKFRKDFWLTKGKVEEDFTLLCIADPQCNTKDLRRIAQESIADIKKTVEGSTLPVYGLCLGDIVADEPGIFQAMRSIIAAVPVPIFHTPGNHDKVAAGSGVPRNANAYKATFGPLNYSFNRGKVHFVSMDNVIYSNADSYSAGFTAEQVEWLASDLQYVSKDKMIILSYHIPLRGTTARNIKEVLDLFDGFAEVQLMCGHTHYTENYINSTRDIYEHIHGALCGAWWHSNINGDGAPNGYATYDIRGNTIDKWIYKPVLADESHQLRIHRGNQVTGGQFEKFAYNNSLYNGITITDNTVFANVWNYDPEWTVHLYENDTDKGEMTLLGTVYDAWSIGYHIGVDGRGTPTSQGGTGGTRSNYLISCKHLFYKEPTDATASIKVVVTDRWGATYEESHFTGGMEYEEAIQKTY